MDQKKFIVAKDLDTRKMLLDAGFVQVSELVGNTADYQEWIFINDKKLMSKFSGNKKLSIRFTNKLSI